MWGFSPLSATALGVCIRSHLWHVLNSWLASVACERPVICNSDHLCWWNCVHQFIAVAVFVWVCVCVPLTWMANNVELCSIHLQGSGSEEPVWSELSINIWWSHMWFCQVPPCSLTTSYLHLSCAPTHSLIPKVTLPPEFFWLQFSCWPNSTVIDSPITNRRTCCPSTTR